MGRKSGRTNPRKKSWRVGNLSWVLTREAVIRIIAPFDDDTVRTMNLRRVLCDAPTYRVRRDGERLLRVRPGLTLWPQPQLFTDDELRAAEHRPRIPATTEPPTTAA